MGHGIVLNRVVLYYGSGEKIRHTIGYTSPGDFEWRSICLLRKVD
jgi:hypothetical protein